eukprot:jgi/Chlat1/9217/Chrsp98S08480
MDSALALVFEKDTKKRLQGVGELQELLCKNGASSASLFAPSNFPALLEALLPLLKDNNFRVCEGALLVIKSLLPRTGEATVRSQLTKLLPPVVERLGDGKQPVRDAGRRLLLLLMQVVGALDVFERVEALGFEHKNWRIREELTRTIAAAAALFSPRELPHQRIVPWMVKLLDDSNSAVREAAVACLEEMYTVSGVQLYNALKQCTIRPAQMKEITTRFNQLRPLEEAAREEEVSTAPAEIRTLAKTVRTAVQPERPSSAPAAVDKPPATPVSARRKKDLSATTPTIRSVDKDDIEAAEPVRVYTERELARELEKIRDELSAKTDWSIRQAAMQRLEGLVLGGATNFDAFPAMLKDLLRDALVQQISDRRSSIAKQACHLVSFLSQELQSLFEPLAEALVPELFKLVVITVHIMAESGDTAVRTVLINCKCPRLVPVIAKTAMKDRSSILRQRCCEYALLMLTEWGEAPEMHRYAETLEELSRAAVADAVSEVRSTARHLCRAVIDLWPERARRFIASLDPSTQKMLDEEPNRAVTKLAKARLSHTTAPAKSQLVQNVPAAAVTATAPKSTTGMHSSALRRVSSAELVAMPPPMEEDTSFKKGLNCLRKSMAPGAAMRIEVTESPVAAVPNSARPDPSNNIRPEFVRADRVTQPQPQSSSHNGPLHNNSNHGLMLPRPTVNAARRVPCAEQPRMETHTAAHHGGGEAPVPSASGPKRVLRSEASSLDDGESLRTSQRLRPPTSDAALEETMAHAMATLHAQGATWQKRVEAFDQIKRLLGTLRGMHEMRSHLDRLVVLIEEHLNDAHHRVVQAVLSTLCELITTYAAPLETYLDRLLPHVFGHLVDSKEHSRALAAEVLEVANANYASDVLLQALVRSLEVQRPPKARTGVLEYALHALTQATAGSRPLTAWVARVAPLTADRNADVRKVATASLLQIYAKVDSTAVLGYLLSAASGEQGALRRLLAQSIPSLEHDIINFAKHKQRTVAVHRTEAAECASTSNASTPCASPTQSKASDPHSIASDNSHPLTDLSNRHDAVATPDGACVGLTMERLASGGYGWNERENSSPFKPLLRTPTQTPVKADSPVKDDAQIGSSPYTHEADADFAQQERMLASVPELVRQMDSALPAICLQGLQSILNLSESDSLVLWQQSLGQVLLMVLETLSAESSDAAVKEAAIQVISQLANRLPQGLEDFLEIVVHRVAALLQDPHPEVSRAADSVLEVMCSLLRPLRLLQVVVPLVLSNDEHLRIAVRMLDRVLARLQRDDLLTQLPTVMPGLIQAFNNASADVRKAVVFCLVDMHARVGGDALMPHLTPLSAAQKKLVTIYIERRQQQGSQQLEQHEQPSVTASTSGPVLVS